MAFDVIPNQVQTPQRVSLLLSALLNMIKSLINIQGCGSSGQTSVCLFHIQIEFQRNCKLECLSYTQKL